MSRKKRQYNVKVKTVEYPNYIVRGCSDPSVMKGWSFCDGDVCPYCYEYDRREEKDGGFPDRETRDGMLCGREGGLGECDGYCELCRYGIDMERDGR